MKKWRKLMLGSFALMFGVAGLCACSANQAVLVGAEGEETSSSTEIAPPEESSSSEVTTPSEETTTEEDNWFKKDYETFVVPLLSGVSITSLLSMVVTILFTFIKNKKLDQKVLLVTQKANDKYQQCEEKLVEIKEILTQVHEIYEMVTKSEKINDETKTYLEEKVKYLVTVIDGNSERVNKIDNLVEIITLLAQLQTKIAKQSDDVVKSGIVEDIDEITTLVKKL